MPTPNIVDLTEQQLQELVADRDKEIAEIVARANSDSSPQAMLDLQVLITKRNEAYAQLAALLRKQQRALDGVVRAMG